MPIAKVTLTVMLAVVFMWSSVPKVNAGRHSAQLRDDLHVDTQTWQLIGGLEVAGSLGLLMGMASPVLGITAAVGLGMLMVCAIVAHARARDLWHDMPAVVLLLGSVTLVPFHVA